MTSEQLNIVFIVLVVLVAAYALYQRYKRGENVTPDYVVSELKAAQPLAQELINVATIAVNSAELMKKNGALQTNDQALNYALDFVKRWIPAGTGIENKDIRAAIESAVLVANALSRQAGAAPSDTLAGR